MIPDQGGDPATAEVAKAARGVVVAVLAGLPVFYTGALAVQLRSSLGFGVDALGGLVATYFVTSALLSVPMGRLVERLGAARATAAGASVGAVALVGAAAAGSWSHLVAALALAGVGNALTQPAANLLISDSIPVRRLGLAFGIKQSCVPAGALVGGIAVPTVALVLGWRWVFGLTAGLAASYAAWLWLVRPRRDPAAPLRPRTPLRQSEAPVTALVLLTVGGFLGAGATTSLGTFLVDAAVDGGVAPGTAGWLYAGLAGGTILARVALGWTLDRDPSRSRFVVIASLLTVGSAGYGLMALGQLPADRAGALGLGAFVAGAVVGYVLGWGWTGLFHYAIVTWYRRSAAAATGVIQTGLSLGAGLGPLGFGLVVASAGYPTAWALAGASSLAAALTVDLARRHLRALRRHRPPAPTSHDSRSNTMLDQTVPGTPAVSDTMDALGLECGVPRGLRPVTGAPRDALAGPARTARVVATDAEDIPGLAELLDGLQPGSVVVLGWDTDEEASVWGGLAATRTAATGCLGLVTDGFVRDVDEVAGLPLAVHARGTTPRSGKGRLAVTGIGEPTTLGGVRVADGDVVVVDATGVCVCPATDADAVVAGAEDLEARDEVFRRELAGGAGFGAARTAAGTM